MATHAGEAEGLGSWCETKRLYNHSKKGGSGAKWSEFADMAMEERRLKVLGESYALVHRLSRKKSDDGGQPWETSSIEVQSPRLKKILEAVLADYPNLESGCYSIHLLSSIQTVLSSVGEDFAVFQPGWRCNLRDGSFST